MKKQIDPNKKLALAPVEKVLIQDIFPDFQTNPGHSHAVVIKLGNKKQKIVNFCSKDYQLVPNDVVYENFKAALKEAGYRFQVSYHVRNDSQFKLDFRILDNTKKVLERDMLIPKVTIKNSYDGKIRFGAQMGFHRVVCSNGLTAASGDQTKVDYMHMPNLYTKRGYDKIINSFHDFLALSKEMIRPYKELAKRKISKSHIEERIVEIVENTDFPKRQVDAAINRALEEHKLYKLELSDWLIYNSLNYQLNHNSSIDLDINRAQNLDSQVLNYMLNK